MAFLLGMTAHSSQYSHTFNLYAVHASRSEFYLEISQLRQEARFGGRYIDQLSATANFLILIVSTAI